jgi:hypothetical protein
VAAGLAGVDTLAALGTATATGHIGFRARFVEEDQPRRIKTGLLTPPGTPRPPDVGAVLFASPERLFLYVSPSRIRT